MVLLIDNYDSFSYNLYQLVGDIAGKAADAEEIPIRIIRNDELTVTEIEALKPSHIILSPGPGKPEDAGICEEAVKKLGAAIPILGVCLGHQAICEVYGATVTYASRLMYGKQSVAEITEESRLLAGLGKKIRVARYHSLAAKKETIPKDLKVTAVSEDGEVMAVEHKKYPVYGLQFHPESILTPEGRKILENFLKIKK